MCFLLSVDVDSPSRVTAFLLSFWGIEPYSSSAFFFVFLTKPQTFLSGFIISHYIEKGKRNFQFFHKKDGNGRFSKFFMDLSFCCKVPFFSVFSASICANRCKRAFFSLETVSDNT